MDTSTPAVILNTTRDHYAHGRLAAARTLGRLGVRVSGVHSTRLSPAALSRFDRSPLICDTADPEALLEELLRLARRVGGRPILISTDDVGTLFVDTYASQLSEAYCFPQRPEGLPQMLADKGELHRMCERLGVPIPRATFPTSRVEAVSMADEATYPIVIKSMDPRLLSQRPNAKSVTVVRSRDELIEAYDRMEDVKQPNLMFQEFVPGGADSVWMFNGYFDAESECLVSVTGRKLRQHPPGTGVTTLGRCEANADVEAATHRLMKSIGYRGIVDMGWRYDERDGSYKLLDVNPRLGATFRLFVGDDGMDVVRALYLDLTGQPVPPTSASDGREWLVEPFDVWTFGALHRAGRLTTREWLTSFRGVDEVAWFAIDDPLPFLGMALLFLLQPLYRRVNNTRWIGPFVRRLARPRASSGRNTKH